MGLEQPGLNPEEQAREQKEAVKSEKEIAWKKNLTHVEQITDKLGKGIDENIKEPVAAFLVHGFTTFGSCEGHIAEEGEEQWGFSYPWIEVYAPEPEGWKEAEGEEKEQLDNEWKAENLEQQSKMLDFLEEFYSGRETPFDARLIFESIGAFGGFRVQSFGAEITEILPPEERSEKLKLYQKEMKDFGEFLKSKYFSQ
ncbi:MAG: hypothetical protein R3251_04285 [Candidatus Spechtbacterales bacterium]|nr:hypothetical protein [Candidatus Spechtbacterales bacterium]